MASSAKRLLQRTTMYIITFSAILGIPAFLQTQHKEQLPKSVIKSKALVDFDGLHSWIPPSSLLNNIVQRKTIWSALKGNAIELS